MAGGLALSPYVKEDCLETEEKEESTSANSLWGWIITDPVLRWKQSENCSSGTLTIQPRVTRALT